MRVKTTEKIIITWKESEIWNDFERLMSDICCEVSADEILGLAEDLQKIMKDLEEYMEVE